MVQLAAEVGQRLNISRLGPQRACDPLTWHGRVARVKDEKRNQLLLPGARRAREWMAIIYEAKASEQLDAQESRNSHVPRLHGTNRNNVGGS
jgi:hypothetical protein